MCTSSENTLPIFVRLFSQKNSAYKNCVAFLTKSYVFKSQWLSFLKKIGFILSYFWDGAGALKKKKKNL